MGSPSSHGWSVGVSVPIYSGGRTFTGFFLEPGVLVRRIDDHDAPADADLAPERAFAGLSLSRRARRGSGSHPCAAAGRSAAS